ncbi:MAG: argininosuccinate synthase [Candidatus Kerfeldbacteria bacterium]|nr:argininosuccinate synthase [Candidatus Kerfeldbacteria bacterium]
MNSTTTYQKVASHEGNPEPGDKVLLLYSGGLDTSVILKWLQDHYQVKVTTLTVGLGQQADDLPVIQQKALKLGATEALIEHAEAEFADRFLSLAIKANARYQGEYYLSCPLGRAIVAEKAVYYAGLLGIHYIAHGCTGKGNDQVRFESYIATLNPQLQTIAPVREWSMGRDEEIAYAKQHGIPVRQSNSKPYSYDENMWGNTGEGGEIETPHLEPPLENILLICKTPEQAPAKGVSVDVEFVAGVPVALNGKKLSLLNLIVQLNKLGAEHAIGITHLIEDRLVGLKVRGVYEQPAAAILITAHYNLEKLVCTRTENDMKSLIDQKWAYLCYGAQWFEPTMQHLNAYIDSVNHKVTGTVKVKLYKGNCTVVALTSPYSLFNGHLATFNKDGLFNQNASAGFIELYGLAQRTAYQVAQQAQQQVFESQFLK